MLNVCLLGTGGMMPLYNRFLTSLLCMYNGSDILIDCGEGTQIAIKKNFLKFKNIDVILITHLHGDHVLGLPGFLLTMVNSGRTKNLIIIGPKGIKKFCESFDVVITELSFKIDFIEIIDDNKVFNFKNYDITSFKVNHSITCYGYSIYINRLKKFDINKAKKNNIPKKYWNKLQHGKTVKSDDFIYYPSDVLGDTRKGLKITYCTDTRPCEQIVDNSKESDLLILEGMYNNKKDIVKARKKQHMIFDEAAKIAKQSNSKELWLTHFSPSLQGNIIIEKDTKKIFKNIIIPQDGFKKRFSFKDI